MLRSVVCVLAMLLIAASEPAMIEVRMSGDDGLTQRLADQVRTTFAAAPGYTADTSAKRLVITIPTTFNGERSMVTLRSPIALKSHQARKASVALAPAGRRT